MRIIVDGMGGDNAPCAIVEGAVLASERIRDEIYIIGKEDEISAELAKYDFDESRMKVIPASQVIENEEAPVRAVRTKKDSSIVKGINMVKNGEADLFISAGNSGALMAGGLFILGRIPGRESDDEIIVFENVGIGALDLMTAARAYDKATSEGIGTIWE